MMIKEASELQTTYEESKIRFLNIALRKRKEANYYINLANAFKTIVVEYESPMDLTEIEDITICMCEAAGVSSKARAYLQPNDINDILTDFIEEYLIPAGQGYVDELIGRYLLTQGDALGGRMKNIIGKIASEKLTQNIIASLLVRNYSFHFFDKKVKNWINEEDYEESYISNIKAVKWENNEGDRLLYYDLNVPVVGKNIDLTLFKKSDVDVSNRVEFKYFISNNINYLALGELKGGIDPAGADEHWKTANTSLSRIRTAFNAVNMDVKTFFIGAAIEASMAEEIFQQYQDGRLTNCANLTKPNQVSEICDWLVTL